jgi:hypothetical protein
MRNRNRFTALFILLALGLSACGGGGGTAPSAPGAPQQPSQPGTATASHTYTLGGAASSYAIPSLAGFGGSVAMPAATVPAATTLSLTSALKAPAGAPAFPTAARPKDAGTLNVYFYTTIQLSATITFQSLPGFSLTLPDTINPAGQQFFYAVSTSTPNSGAVQSFGTQGPATVAGQTVTFTPTNTPLTLLAGTSYIVAFYATSAVAATATPTATPTVLLTATPTPTPTPTATPTVLLTATPTPTPTPTATPTVLLTATPTPPPIPPSMTEDDTAYAYSGNPGYPCFGGTGTYHATWTFPNGGTQGTGLWTNNMAATLVVQQWNASGVVIDRADTPSSIEVGLTAIYKGQITGNVADGTVTYSGDNGNTCTGTWSATW